MAALLERVGTRLVEVLTFNDKFYLNNGVTWAMVRAKGDGGTRPQPQYLLVIPVITLLILVSRFAFERFVALRVGRYLEVNERRPTPPEPNAILEKAFKKTPKPNDKLVTGLAKSTNKSVRYIERWFRRARSVSLPSNMRKFQEGSWRFLAYLTLLTVGCFVVPNKDYWLDTRKNWLLYPNRSMTEDIFWYYMVELSFYVSLTISQFLDIRRKDFWQMFIHHIVTIFLISFSYCVNFFAIGATIMFVHDMADPWLELAKILGYVRRDGEGRSKKQYIGEGLFLLFMAVFYYSRLYLYPLHCLQSTIFEKLEILGPVWPMYIVFNALLITLLVLHCFWSIQILRVVKESIIAGKVKGDVRSCDEDSTGEEEPNSGTKPVEAVLNSAPGGRNGKSPTAGSASNGHSRSNQRR